MACMGWSRSPPSMAGLGSPLLGSARIPHGLDGLGANYDEDSGPLLISRTNCCPQPCSVAAPGKQPSMCDGQSATRHVLTAPAARAERSEVLRWTQ